MPYRFKLDEPFDEGVRRVVRAQVDLALGELGDGPVPPTGVHACRKAIKRLRALVRLVGPAFKQDAAKRHETSLKQLARLLSDARDRAVLLETIEMLRARADRDVAEQLSAMAAWVRGGSGGQAVFYDDRSAARVRARLKALSKDVDETPIRGRGFGVVAKGMAKSYSRGCKAVRRANRVQTSDAYHELRKAVQTHWRHVSLLSRAWPDMFALRIAEVRELSQRLGEDHDIAVLVQAARKIAKAPDSPLTPAGLQAISALAASEQYALRMAFRGRAERVFAETPDAFATRMQALWKAARRMEKSSRNRVQPISPAKAKRAQVQLVLNPVAEQADCAHGDGPRADGAHGDSPEARAASPKAAGSHRAR